MGKTTSVDVGRCSVSQRVALLVPLRSRNTESMRPPRRALTAGGQADHRKPKTGRQLIDVEEDSRDEYLARVRRDVWLCSPARGITLLVHLALVEIAFRQGEGVLAAQASQKQIAGMARCSRNTVRKALTELEFGGWIVNYGQHGQDACYYLLNPVGAGDE